MFYAKHFVYYVLPWRLEFLFLFFKLATLDLSLSLSPKNNLNIRFTLRLDKIYLTNVYCRYASMNLWSRELT